MQTTGTAGGYDFLISGTALVQFQKLANGMFLAEMDLGAATVRGTCSGM